MSLVFQTEAFQGLDSCATVWRELEPRAEAPFFLTWDWIGTWLEESRIEPLVLTGRYGGEIVLLGLLVPWKRSDTRLWSTYGLRLHTTGVAGQDVITIEYNSFLIDKEWAGRAEPEALAFLTSGISVAGRRRDELHLQGVVSEYESFVPPSMLAQVVARKPSYRIDLDAVRASGKPYLDHLSANTRQQIRRSVRLYEQRGKLETRRARDVGEAMRFVDGLADLHQRYWTKRGEPGGFGHPFFESFLRRLTERCLPRGSIELVQINCGNEAIGYVYNFVHRGHIYYYLTGFLYEDDPRLKPGLVSHYMCIELHLREQARIYDFMAGDARYKASLGKPGPEMLYLIIQRPTGLLRLENTLRDVKQRVEARLRKRAVL